MKPGEQQPHLAWQGIAYALPSLLQSLVFGSDMCWPLVALKHSVSLLHALTPLSIADANPVKRAFFGIHDRSAAQTAGSWCWQSARVHAARDVPQVPSEGEGFNTAHRMAAALVAFVWTRSANLQTLHLIAV